MLEKYLIEHCSPTLASLKTANLFTFSYNREAELSNQLNSWNQKLSGRGIELAVLRKRGAHESHAYCSCLHPVRDSAATVQCRLYRAFNQQSTDF